MSYYFRIFLRAGMQYLQNIKRYRNKILLSDIHRQNFIRGQLIIDIKK